MGRITLFKKKKKDNNINIDNKTDSNNMLSENEERRIEGGLFGDRDKRTKRAARGIGLGFLTVLFFVLFVVNYTKESKAYNNYLVTNTTPIGTKLPFTQTKASLGVDGVWTDESKKVIVVKLKYDTTAHNTLSSKGTNYLLYLITKPNQEPKNLAMEYGLLGTDGDGYLIIKGDFEKKAYQVYITNQAKLAKGTDSVKTEQAAKEEESITKKLADYSMNSIDDNGILTEKKDSKEKGADSINFRVNPFSDTTVVCEGSFLDSKGDIDYEKIIDSTTVEPMVKNEKQKETIVLENIERLKNTKVEYEDRLKENDKDVTAKSNILDIDKRLEEENKNLESVRETIKSINEYNLGKNTFGEMQKGFKIMELN